MAATSTLSVETARSQAQEVARRDLPFEEQVNELLALGKQSLGVQNGHFTKIDQDKSYWEAIGSTDPTSGEFPPGLSLDLDSTYCRRTIEADSPITLHHASNQGWEDDQAYRDHGLETYLGTSLFTSGSTDGTLCFVSEGARAEPFSEEELRLLEHLSFLMSNLLQEQRYEGELQDRERLLDLVNRILRHNLRNDLTVVLGHAEMLHNRVDSEDSFRTETILNKSDQLITKADKIRTLQSELTRAFEREDHDVEAIIESTVEETQREFPNASIAIGETPDAPIELSSRIEIALHEIVENAAKYTGQTPHVEISSYRTDGAVEIEVVDNGPGIPDQELITVRDEQENPLEHGSGVGLTLASMIITDHNGELEIDSNESGTTVCFSIPLSPTQLTA